MSIISLANKNLPQILDSFQFNFFSTFAISGNRRSWQNKEDKESEMKRIQNHNEEDTESRMKRIENHEWSWQWMKNECEDKNYIEMVEFQRIYLPWTTTSLASFIRSGDTMTISWIIVQSVWLVTRSSISSEWYLSEWSIHWLIRSRDWAMEMNDWAFEWFGKLMVCEI